MCELVLMVLGPVLIYEVSMYELVILRRTNRSVFKFFTLAVYGFSICSSRHYFKVQFDRTRDPLGMLLCLDSGSGAVGLICLLASSFPSLILNH